MKSSRTAYHDPGRVVPLITPERVEDFRSRARGASREHLRNTVDHYLEQIDVAVLVGDRHAQAWARKRWNIVWDELDRRDGISTEVAS
jgi:hypothetical protein